MIILIEIDYAKDVKKTAIVGADVPTAAAIGLVLWYDYTINGSGCQTFIE